MFPQLVSRGNGGADDDLLLWRLPRPMLAASTAVSGGGVGARSWIVNVQVPHDYQRRAVVRHVSSVARSLQLRGRGVGMLTAAPVSRGVHECDDEVSVHATVGLGLPTWAASQSEVLDDFRPGTINVVAFLPVRLSPGGLLNALTTVTEAKVQALWEAGVAATGTATDAACVVCPVEGPRDLYGGPRSTWGSRLARATYAAVLVGARGWSA